MNLFDLSGRVALITGGAHSIGFALGVGLAQAGATVCFNCSSEASRERGLKAYAEAGIQVHDYVADVTDEQAVKAMLARIEAEVGVVDILVNNAGVIKRIPMTDMSVEDFTKVIDVDLIAPFICSKAVIPGMIAKACDGFAPIGPFFVPRDQLQADRLDISCRVNGVYVQRSNTCRMIFSCAEIVSYLSDFICLKKGDLIFTGTPSGVILGKEEAARSWLKAGDLVAVEIEGIGTLENKLV